jgi:hypothetical protein
MKNLGRIGFRNATNDIYPRMQFQRVRKWTSVTLKMVLSNCYRDVKVTVLE